MCYDFDILWRLDGTPMVLVWRLGGVTVVGVDDRGFWCAFELRDGEEIRAGMVEAPSPL